MSDEAPSLDFATPEFTYDELEAKLAAYLPDPGRYPHDEAVVICVAEGIRAGRNGNIAVVQPANDYACMVDCLHVDDVAELLAAQGLAKRPEGK